MKPACHGVICKADGAGPTASITENAKLQGKPMSDFHYVYILVDEATGTHFYIGCTEDLKSRLEKHNKGDVPHTSKFKPWRIKNAIAFENKEKAYAFEAYLKTHCGRAFAKRHF